MATPEIAPQSIVIRSGCEEAIAKFHTEEIAIRIIDVASGRLNFTLSAIALPQIIPVVTAARLSDQLRGPLSHWSYAKGPNTCQIDSKHMLMTAKAQTIAITQGREINSFQPTRKS